MNQKMPSRKSDEDPIADFMNQVEEKGDNLPTMEELAQLPPKETMDLLKQISQEEQKEAARVSHRNRTGATLEETESKE